MTRDLTALYAVKRAIIDALAAQTGVGQALEGVQVLYAYEGTVSDRCIYAGGGSYDQPGDADAYDGTDVLVAESDTVSLYIRVVGHGLTVRETEAQAEAIGDQLAAAVRGDPALAGVNTTTRVAGGTGDFAPTDDGPIVVIACRLNTSAYL